MNTTGKLVNVLEVEQGTSKAGKEWVKRTFVIDTGAKYNPLIAFGLFGEEKVALLEEVTIGDTIEVAFNLSSREFKGKYYTQADAWKLSKATAAVEEEDANDLPF